jgi:aminobenzoyl-glutamate utilization protein B
MQVSWGDSSSNASSRSSTASRASAHAAGVARLPALDAVELMDIGWNPPRALRIQQRSHYVITNGGDQPNVVPPNATVWHYSARRLRPHQGDGTSVTDGAGRDDDDQHQMSMRVLGPARPGPRQDRRRDDAREHREGRPAEYRGGSDVAKALQKELKVPEVGRRRKSTRLRGCEVIPDDEKRGGLTTSATSRGTRPL